VSRQVDASSFVFTDRGGQRWKQMKLGAAVLMTALLSSAVLFLWFLLQ
jgi:hypothetical protein